MSGLYNWVKRNRGRLLMGGAAVGGLLVAGRVLERQMVRAQEAERSALLVRSRRQQHFQSTEETTDRTLRRLLGTLQESVTRLFCNQNLREVLKSRPSSEKKLEIWEELKVLAYSKNVTYILGSVYLAVMLRIEMNLLAGHLFCERSQNLATSSPLINNNSSDLVGQERGVQISDKLKEKYLATASNFVTEGIKELAGEVRNGVEKILSGVGLQQELVLGGVEAHFQSILTALRTDSLQVGAGGAGEISRNPGKFFLGSGITLEGLARGEGDRLKEFYSETLDLLDSEDVTGLVWRLCSQGCAHLLDQLAQHFVDAARGDTSGAVAAVHATMPPSGSEFNGGENRAETQNGHVTGDHQHDIEEEEESEEVPFVSPTEIRLPLAKLVPIISSLVPTRTQTGPGLDDGEEREEGEEEEVVVAWFNHLRDNEELRVLGANVYESFCQEPNQPPNTTSWIGYITHSVSSLF